MGGGQGSGDGKSSSGAGKLVGALASNLLGGSKSQTPPQNYHGGGQQGGSPSGGLMAGVSSFLGGKQHGGSTVSSLLRDHPSALLLVHPGVMADVWVSTEPRLRILELGDRRHVLRPGTPRLIPDARPRLRPLPRLVAPRLVASRRLPLATILPALRRPPVLRPGSLLLVRRVPGRPLEPASLPRRPLSLRVPVPRPEPAARWLPRLRKPTLLFRRRPRRLPAAAVRLEQLIRREPALLADPRRGWPGWYEESGARWMHFQRAAFPFTAVIHDVF